VHQRRNDSAAGVDNASRCCRTNLSHVPARRRRGCSAPSTAATLSPPKRRMRKVALCTRPARTGTGNKCSRAESGCGRFSLRGCRRWHAARSGRGAYADARVRTSRPRCSGVAPLQETSSVPAGLLLRSSTSRDPGMPELKPVLATASTPRISHAAACSR
jgi:hypothetical protein